jgi:hypothetical protein
VCGWSQTSLAEENTAKSTANASAAEVETVKLTIHPKAESKPSLKIQLVPDPTEQLEGNAAVFYLKAMGFLEQDPTRDRLREMEKIAREKAKASGNDISEFPPFVYQDLPPKAYPVEEVRDYLSMLRFQVLSIREARMMRDFSMHRNLHLSDNPIGYLLPEIQNIRSLARTQSVRCRLAIAENRIDDAIEVIGQQVTMSRHIAMDDFMVSYLVGCAVFSMAIDDTLFLIQQSDCPNLYWAFAQLPHPFLSAERSLAFERQLVYLQVPKLKEIDATPRSAEYWKEFLADFARRTVDVDEYIQENNPAIVSKELGDKRIESIQNAIEENVPQAKAYLLGRGLLTSDAIEKYPKEQLVFWAMKDYYDVNRDEQFKWFHLPYRVAVERIEKANEQTKTDREKLGWFANLPIGLVPSIEGFQAAVMRVRQRIALIQTIEAIRMAGAENGGKLIDSLDQAPVPVPNDPFTDKPFAYQVSGDIARLSSDYPVHAAVRIELRFAK